MNARLKILNNQISGKNSLIYKANDGKDLMFNPTIYKEGDSVLIEESKNTLKISTLYVGILRLMEVSLIITQGMLSN